MLSTGLFVELLEEINSINELLSRSSSLTIAEIVTQSLNEGLVLNYNEVKLNLRNKYCSAFQFQFGSNLVNYIKA